MMADVEAPKKRGPKGGPRRHPNKPREKTLALIPVYAALFAERRPDGRPLSLTEIGKRLGVSREAVRAFRRTHFPQLPDIREVTPTNTRRRRAMRLFSTQLWKWRATVRSWLEAEGYFQCGHCRMVLCDGMQVKKTHGHVCKPCLAARVARSRRLKRC